jgi:hypothetical protein
MSVHDQERVRKGETGKQNKQLPLLLLRLLLPLSLSVCAGVSLSSHTHVSLAAGVWSAVPVPQTVLIVL